MVVLDSFPPKLGCFSSGKFCEDMVCVLAMSEVSQTTAEQLEIHVRRLAVWAGSSQAEECFLEEVRLLCIGAPGKMGVLPFGVRECTPLLMLGPGKWVGRGGGQAFLSAGFYSFQRMSI